MNFFVRFLSRWPAAWAPKWTVGCTRRWCLTRGGACRCGASAATCCCTRAPRTPPSTSSFNCCWRRRSSASRSGRAPPSSTSAAASQVGKEAKKAKGTNLRFLVARVAGSLSTSVLAPDLYLVGASAGVYALLTSQLANIILVSWNLNFYINIICFYFLHILSIFFCL